ncbi:MAG TPA: sensor histidine kinase [Candidatus Acidoferrales bacterium]|nr:sensor histidine kinase [Candidatus Acidoferrales bacterium]
MSFQQSDRLHFERQILYGRPFLILLSLVALLERTPAREARQSLLLLAAYMALALAVIPVQHFLRGREWRLPLLFDVLALVLFMYVTPSSVPAWFPYAFVCYAAGIRWGMDAALPLAGALSLALVLFTAHAGEVHWMRILSWVGLTAGTFAGGAGLAFLGDRSRRFAAENEFFSRISATLQVDQGLAESLRLLLDELAAAFHAEEALLVYRDVDLERIFLWRLKQGESERLIPENLPLARTDGLLLDDLDATLCWNSLVDRGSGFGWDRRDGRTLKNVPRLPGPAVQDFKIRSFMTAAFEQAGQPAGRIFVLNGRKHESRPFAKSDLAWLERIARYISPALENLFLLRHLRARAIEAERSRISRDLHDGILQTLLSIEIQIDVLRRRVPVAPDQAVAGLSDLQQTVRNEGADLRAFVTDLRPVRVQSADLVDLMRGFAERFRNESTLALDLLIDSAELRAPDRVCRELFQIYREALNNIKKHAKASHVVVKLSQDDSRLVLVVDDNGEGFSFAGRFTGDELDRLRLGPISIKERARTVGGVLTVESNPGHGARLTVEVPLG